MEKKGQTTGNSGIYFTFLSLFFLFRFFLFSIHCYHIPKNQTTNNMTNIISLEEVAKHNTKGRLVVSFNCNSCNIDVKNKRTT